MLLDDPKKVLQPSLSFTTLGNSSQDTLAWQHVLLDRAAASALTLVSPVAPADEHTAALVFSHDSLFNSTISLGGDDLYRIRSDGRGIKTWVFRRQSKLDDELLCTYDRRLLGSVLKWPGKETIRVGKYIRPSKSRPEGARHAAQFEHEGETYEWRIDIMGKMACYVEGAPMLDPVAWYNRQKRAIEGAQAVIRPAALCMKESAAFSSLRDVVLITWIVVSETARTWPYNVTAP